MTLDQLKSNLKFLQKRHQQVDAINEALEDFNPDFPTYFPSDDLMENMLVEAWSRELGDTADNWLFYYIYELEFGKKFKQGDVLDEEGNPIPLATVEDLWNLILSVKKEI